MINDNQLNAIGVIPTNKAERIPIITGENEWIHVSIIHQSLTSTTTLFIVPNDKKYWLTQIFVAAQLNVGDQCYIEHQSSAGGIYGRLWGVQSSIRRDMEMSIPLSTPKPFISGEKLVMKVASTIRVIGVYTNYFEETL